MAIHDRLIVLIASLLLAGGCSRDGESTPARELQGSPQPPSPTSAASPPPASSTPSSPANREVKVRHLSGRAYLVEDFGAIPDGPINSVIAGLKARALAGDATASYAIFLKINECADINRRTSKGLDPRANPATAEDCLKLPAQDEVSSSEWLTLAAEQGNIGARLLYSMDSESALGGPAEMLRDPDRTKEYKQRAVGYLQEMASQGSTDALLQLGNAYHAGVLVNEDLVASRAYFEAARLTDQSVVPTQQLQNLDKSLSAEQLSTALIKGAQIHGSCCR